MIFHRGQVTIYIIIGILLIFSIILIFPLFQTSKIDETAGHDPIEMQPVKSNIDQCLENSIIEGIIMIGAQGGYYDLPENSDIVMTQILFDETINTTDDMIVDSDLNIDFAAYYLRNHTTMVPDESNIAKELEDFINISFFECVGESDLIETLNVGNLEDVEITIGQDMIRARLVIPIEYQIGDSIKRTDKFEAAVPFELWPKYDLAKRFIEEQKKDTEFFPLGYLTYLATEEGFSYEQTTFDNKVFLCFLFDENDLFGIYRYCFLLEYPWTREDIGIYESDNLLTQVVQTKDYEKNQQYDCQVGYDCQIDIRVEAQDYSDNTDLFNITNSLISFVPESKDVGNHKVLISADEKTITLDINIDDENRLPILVVIPDFTISQGDLFEYSVSATDPDGDSLIYMDDSALFNIDPRTGEISFTATDVGYYNITISVIDEYSKMDSQVFYLRVNP
ncbi:hypothetical protein K9M79_05745 [Candidatus Woesearchaeota archaeon]|nr:hypothetical protein [Candidatus Woesearchaeota archaeon]